MQGSIRATIICIHLCSLVHHLYSAEFTLAERKGKGKQFCSKCRPARSGFFWSLRIVLPCAASTPGILAAARVAGKQRGRCTSCLLIFLCVCFLSIPEQVDRANRGVASKLQGQSPARTVNGTRLNYMYHCRPVPMSSFSEQPCCGLCSVVLLISHV